jgi:hypothetical protein
MLIVQSRITTVIRWGEIYFLLPSLSSKLLVETVFAFTICNRKCSFWGKFQEEQYGLKLDLCEQKTMNKLFSIKFLFWMLFFRLKQFRVTRSNFSLLFTTWTGNYLPIKKHRHYCTSAVYQSRIIHMTSRCRPWISRNLAGNRPCILCSFPGSLPLSSHEPVHVKHCVTGKAMQLHGARHLSCPHSWFT